MEARGSSAPGRCRYYYYYYYCYYYCYYYYYYYYYYCCYCRSAPGRCRAQCTGRGDN